MYQKKLLSRKTRVRKLANQILENLTDIYLELDREDTEYEYIIDYCDEMKETIFDMKGLCFTRRDDY